MYNTSTIKSRDNARLKFARRVRDGKESRHIFAEGLRLCTEAFSSGLTINECFVSATFYSSTLFGSFEPALTKGVATFVMSEVLLSSIADTKTPQGIVLVAERPSRPQLGKLFFSAGTKQTPSVWVYLYKVNNPSNLGAVARTAEAAGANGILVSPGSADPFSPKSIRASMGSMFRLPVVEGCDLDEVLTLAKEKGIRVSALASDGDLNYLIADWKMPRLLIFGSEAQGLPEDVISRADEVINIPMSRNVQSLNLAVSSGIILFEAKRQIEN